MSLTLTWLDLCIVACAAFGTFAIVSFFEKLVFRPKNAHPIDTQNKAHNDDVLSFEFDLTGTLVCSNVAGDEFLNRLRLDDPDWLAVRETLASRFPDLPQTIESSPVPTFEILDALSPADPKELEIEQHAQGLTLVLRARSVAIENEEATLHRVLSSLPNLSLVHAVSEHAPFPVWQTLPDGTLGWSNIFYQTLSARVAQNNAPLFDFKTPIEEKQAPIRMSLKDEEHNRTYWFDVTHHKFGESTLHFANDVHAVVTAESAQRNFVQTLAKTFAHLAIGLAIFDRKRQLVLFNPSLLDITELRPDFLTARPNLFSFFDQLRNNQVMPEPKNYANWRERIADVISAASDDNFNETWHLPNGLTYRVTGRPHPDGAIAFLFEDISAEISLTRRFRAEAAVTRSAFDSLEQAVAIFNPGGFLQHCNAAMTEFMGNDDDQNSDNMSVRDLTRLCQVRCKPNPAWGEIRDFVSGGSERETWTATLEHENGQSLELRVAPLASGASLIMLDPLPSISALKLDNLLTHDSAQHSSTAAA